MHIQRIRAHSCHTPSHSITTQCDWPLWKVWLHGRSVQDKHTEACVQSAGATAIAGRFHIADCYCFWGGVSPPLWLVVCCLDCWWDYVWFLHWLWIQSQVGISAAKDMRLAEAPTPIPVWYVWDELAADCYSASWCHLATEIHVSQFGVISKPHQPEADILTCHHSRVVAWMTFSILCFHR